MFWRSLTTLGLIGALAVAPADRADADAGDFIGGAIVGGLIGHAITKGAQNNRRTTTQRVVTSSKRKSYRPRIPVTEQGRRTQTALNYFGYNAGRVDGQVGRGTRAAIERYQTSMGYPVNGGDFQPYQFDFLMDAYWWAQNGGEAATRRTGRPLLMAYRNQVQNGGPALAVAPQQAAPQPGQVTTVIVPAPQVVQPSTAPVVEAAAQPEEEAPAPALPNLFAGGAPSVSLANRCNAVMLETSTNGGYTTLASMTDGDFTLSEQFCLARSYAIARGEELMAQVQGLTQLQIAEQCGAFGTMLKAQVDAVSLRPQAEAEAEMRSFALGTGIRPADLAATSRVCLAVGYSQDNMNIAVGAALMLATLGEPAYGELLGHHLREGFGTAERRDLAMQWYEASLSALEGGASAAFMPGQSGRPQLLRAAMISLSPMEKQGVLTAPEAVQNATLPTFTVSD